MSTHESVMCDLRVLESDRATSMIEYSSLLVHIHTCTLVSYLVSSMYVVCVMCDVGHFQPCQEYHLHFSLAKPRRKAGEREVACSSQRSFHLSLFERAMKTWAPWGQ